MSRPLHPTAVATHVGPLLQPPSWWTALVDLVLPVRCPGCGGGPGAPCPDCARHLLGLRPAPLAVPGCPVPVVAAGEHAGVLRALLLAHKERGRVGLSVPLGAVLADAVAVAIDLAAPGPGSGWVLVPVPSRPRAVRARGQDTVAALARSAAAWSARAGVPMSVLPLLRHGRRVQDQVGLSTAERARNLAGALHVDPRLREQLAPGARIVVVDDVGTSGATLVEAVRALRTSGTRVVAAAALAQARRHGPPRTNVEAWHPSGSVVALPEGRASAVRG